MLYFSNRASICSHALIILSPTRWIVMTGWRTSISLQPFVQLQPFDQTRLDCGLCCLQASYPPCVTNTFGMWIFVCVHVSVPALCFKHLWIRVPCLGTSICLLLLGSNTFVSHTFGLRFLVWIVDLCLCTRIHLQPCSNPFDYSSCLSPSRPHQKEVTPELETFFIRSNGTCVLPDRNIIIVGAKCFRYNEKSVESTTPLSAAS